MHNTILIFVLFQILHFNEKTTTNCAAGGKGDKNEMKTSRVVEGKLVHAKIS